MALYANQSCKKEDNDDIILSETIEVTIGQKESFSYTLPNSNNNKLFTVRDQSNNFAVTSINTDNTASTFVYTRSENFTGTDLVVLSHENNQRTNNGKGCQHHHERWPIRIPHDFWRKSKLLRSIRKRFRNPSEKFSQYSRMADNIYCSQR